MANANCNWWQYARWTYLIGRTTNSRAFTDAEKQAVIDFIANILESRPGLTPRVNLKKGNESELAKQNDWCLGKMLQVIGRQLKVVPPTDEEKNLCDTLFEATDPRRYKSTAITTSEESDSSSKNTDESSSSSQSDKNTDESSSSSQSDKNTDESSSSSQSDDQ